VRSADPVHLANRGKHPSKEHRVDRPPEPSTATGGKSISRPTNEGRSGRVRPLSSIPATPVARARAATGRLIAKARGVAGEPGGFKRLIDAKAAGQLLGVPHTWLLAQAREGRVPHHRLGHYVRFDPEDLTEWLKENRIEPRTDRARLR
jgi:excisionase family DNA binding protein